jgi:hypothetical protein
VESTVQQPVEAYPQGSLRSRNSASRGAVLDVDKGLPLRRKPLRLRRGSITLLDDVEGNAETWFLARCFRILQKRHAHLGGLISYSDPLPRTSVAGDLVKPGHIGTIYQAHNARYVGRATPETLTLDREGRVVSRRSISKLRNDEAGAAGAYHRLLLAGAPPRRLGESGPAYCTRALRDGPFRTIKHPGNLTYCWSLRPDVVIRLPAKPYEKNDSIERQHPLF